MSVKGINILNNGNSGVEGKPSVNFNIQNNKGQNMNTNTQTQAQQPVQLSRYGIGLQMYFSDLGPSASLPRNEVNLDKERKMRLLTALGIDSEVAQVLIGSGLIRFDLTKEGYEAEGDEVSLWEAYKHYSGGLDNPIVKQVKASIACAKNSSNKQKAHMLLEQHINTLAGGTQPVEHTASRAESIVEALVTGLKTSLQPEQPAQQAANTNSTSAATDVTNISDYTDTSDSSTSLTKTEWAIVGGVGLGLVALGYGIKCWLGSDSETDF